MGGGGSGKTTLARRLAERLELPHFELDVPGAALDPLLLEDRWVGDGVYLYGITPVLDRAELIIWLDLRRWTAIRRIITRHIRLSMNGTNRHKGLRRLVKFAWGQRDYYSAPAREPRSSTDWDALTRAGTELVLRPHMKKVIRLRSPGEVRRWTRTFLQQAPTSKSAPAPDN